MFPSGVDLDGLCEFALEFLMNGRGDARRLTAALVMGLPEWRVSGVILLLALTASGLETNFAGAESARMAADVWRMAALLGVDLNLMAELGLPGTLCADLLQHWQAEDDFFLRPAGKA